MKRFTKRLENGKADYAVDIEAISVNHADMLDKAYEQDDLIRNRLCDLEDKIEQGVLIEVPCIMGTELFFIIYNPKADEHEIFSTKYWYYRSLFNNEDGKFILRAEINDIDYEWEEYIQVDYFLTRAEAEKRLKELENE